jgi:hypothetical protein
MPIIDFGLGLDYSRGDFDTRCGTDGDTELTHYRLHASAAVALVSLVVAEGYAGGGISHHWFSISGLECSGSKVSDKAGYHVFLGAATSGPGLPFKMFVEGRMGWLAGDPNLHTRSIYLGVELSL